MDITKATAGSARRWSPASGTQSAGARPFDRATGTTSERVNGAPRVASARSTDRLAAWGMAAILLLLAYEWLLSSLNKLLSADFRAGLADELRESIADNPNHWYVRVLNDGVISHARAVAFIVEWGEIFVALGLALGAVLWIVGDRLSVRWLRRLHLVVIGSLLGAAFMTANYYLMDGNKLPWLNTGAPFDEGLGLDGLLTLVALALVAVEVLAVRAPVAVAHQEQAELSHG
jgi:thiosulfate dehydrogenase [quinone] large subunit